MSEGLTRESVVDEEHLKLLYIGYLISAAFSALFALLGIFYVLMGAMMSAVLSHAPEKATKSGQPPPAFIGWFFAAIGLLVIFFSVAFAILKFQTASRIKQRKSRIFCMVIAAFSCLEFPYGTALGVATFIVLGRESVTRLFDPGAAPQFSA